MCSEEKLTDFYVLGESLGSGTYSVVKKGIRKVGRREVVAIKIIPKSRLKNKKAIDNIVTEIELMKSFNHEHIVKMLDFLWDKENIYIILEYCPGGDLSRFIRQRMRLPEIVARRFLQQLAQALDFLHSRHIVHMDLKPQNILMVGQAHRMQLKLADFGFAKHLDPEGENVKECRGSPLYMAPEIFTRGGVYTEKCDLWSVGVILYECLFGRAPYHSSTFKELETKLTRNTPIEIPSGAGISDECEDLLSGLLNRDPKGRLSHEEFVRHPFVDLEHAPCASSLGHATAKLQAAVEADRKKQAEKALELYADGLSHLVSAVAFEPDEKKRSALREKVKEYMERAEVLREKLEADTRRAALRPPKPPPPATEVTDRRATLRPRPTTRPNPENGSKPQDGRERKESCSPDELAQRLEKLVILSEGTDVLMKGAYMLKNFHKQIQSRNYDNALLIYEELFELVSQALQKEPSSSERRALYLAELERALTLAEAAKAVIQPGGANGATKRTRKKAPPTRRSLSVLEEEEEEIRKTERECCVM